MRKHTYVAVGTERGWQTLMRLRGSNSARTQATQPARVFSRAPAALAGERSFLQWTIVGILGIVLGISTLAVSSLPPKWVPPFVLAALCPFIAMIVGNARTLLLGIIILDIPLQLDINLFYQEEAAALGAVAGLEISVTTICLAALYALWLAQLLRRVAYPPPHLLRMSLPLAAYLAFVILSVLVAHNVSLSLFEIALLSQMFLLFIYIVSTVRTQQEIVFIVAMLLVGAIIQGVSMIAVYFTGQDFSFGGISTRVNEIYTRGQFFRPGGTIGSPITAASYLGLLLAPAISVVFTPLRSYYKWLAALCFSLGVIGLLLTLSRGGWIAFVLSAGILCFFAWRRGWLSVRILLFLSVVVLLVSLLFRDPISTRLLGYDADSAYSRIPLTRLAFLMSVDNPVLGVGANNFAVAMMRYVTIGFPNLWVYTVHNKYLLVSAETGIGGLAAFSWFLFATIRRGWQSWQLGDRLLSPLALGFTAALVGQMVHMFVDMFHDRPQVQSLWVTCALLVAMRTIASSEVASRHPQGLPSRQPRGS